MSGIPMTAAEKARFTLPILRSIWDQEVSAVLSPLMPFFNARTTRATSEYSQGLGATGLVPEYNSANAEKPGTGLHFDTFDELYEKTFTIQEYADGMAIERKLYDTDQAGVIRSKTSSFGNKYARTRAYHASSVLNNAFSSSYLGGDSKALCASDHPVNKVSSSTFSNAGSSVFSYSAVGATIVAGLSMTDDRGNPFPVNYDTLYLPNAFRISAKEILEAVGKPGTGNNDANGVSGITVLFDPWLSDANNWFMIDSAMARQHLIWYNLTMPEFEMNPTSVFDLVFQYRGYMAYSYGWDDARWIYGHNVT
jgi:hypothetical protein